jgi:hypothetical protein
MTLEERLDQFLKQPGTSITHEELGFIAHMRECASHGVGYGWMQQVIEWEWQSKDPHGAWGPERFASERRAP